MRPITLKMQRVLNTALIMRDGIVHAGRPQACGLIERGLAIGYDRDTVRGGMLILVKKAGYALAERTEYVQNLRDDDHAAALVERPVKRGDVVDYHGSKTDEHDVFYVLGFDPGHAGERYKIANRDYPWFVLSLVRRESITPTGEHAELCQCHHEYTYCTRGRAGLCAVTSCRCDQHAPVAAPEAV